MDKRTHTYDLVVADDGDRSVGIPSLVLPIQITIPLKEKRWIESNGFEQQLKDFLTEFFCETNDKTLTAEEYKKAIEHE